jgi:hypothetical protein
MTERWGRRRWLRVVGVALGGVLAGCAGRTTERAVTARGDGCADAFRVVAESARLGSGRVPEVRLRLTNGGEAAVDYEVTVQFRQRTSLGLAEPSGRATVVGSLAPGASAVETVTGEGAEARSTDGYELAATVACRG